MRPSPLTLDESPLAVLESPPLTLEAMPLAVLLCPPLTLELKPLAALPTPPLTLEYRLLAPLPWPPLTLRALMSRAGRYGASSAAANLLQCRQEGALTVGYSPLDGSLSRSIDR